MNFAIGRFGIVCAGVKTTPPPTIGVTPGARGCCDVEGCSSPAKKQAVGFAGRVGLAVADVGMVAGDKEMNSLSAQDMTHAEE